MYNPDIEESKEQHVRATAKKRKEKDVVASEPIRPW